MATPPLPAHRRPEQSVVPACCFVCSAYHDQVAGAKCQRCGVGKRFGQGQGWCSDPECRKAEKAERLAAQLAEKNARQQERAARGCGARGPLPVEGISTRAKRQQLQAARDEDGLGSRGPPPPDGVSTRAQRQQLQAAREEDGLGSRGPPPPCEKRTDSAAAGPSQTRTARERSGSSCRPHEKRTDSAAAVPSPSPPRSKSKGIRSPTKIR